MQTDYKLAKVAAANFDVIVGNTDKTLTAYAVLWVKKSSCMSPDSIAYASSGTKESTTRPWNPFIPQG